MQSAPPSNVPTHRQPMSLRGCVCVPRNLINNATMARVPLSYYISSFFHLLCFCAVDVSVLCSHLGARLKFHKLMIHQTHQCDDSVVMAPTTTTTTTPRGKDIAPRAKAYLFQSRRDAYNIIVFPEDDRKTHNQPSHRYTSHTLV